MIIILFVAFYLYAIYAEKWRPDRKQSIAFVTCMALAVMAGMRDPIRWADTDSYLYAFKNYTPTLVNLSSNDTPFGYVEMGFFYISVVVKTFTSNSELYFTIVAGLSMYFLYLAVKRYCYYPLLGLCAYISRFLIGRNFIQIRAGLSYAIILLAVQYITKRDWKRYFGLVLIAYLFHHSALLAIPLYFLCLVKVKRVHILWGLVFAFVIAGYFSNVIRVMVAGYVVDLNVDTTYIQEEFQREWGLANPMIYFQTLILLIYTYGERKLQYATEHYFTIRNAYFYSTVMLIILSCYTALSGRVSSMFATFEFVIIPSLLFTFTKNQRWLGYGVMGVALTAIFFMNYYGH